MATMRTFKYRLYPTQEQTESLKWVLRRLRELYNAALSERRDAWKYAKKSITLYDQIHDIPAIRGEIRPEYQSLGAHLLQDPLKRVDRAYKAFFKRCKAGQTPGHPRFKGERQYDSFCYPDKTGWKLTYKQEEPERAKKKKRNATLELKLGEQTLPIKVRMHRPLPDGAKIKTCTVKREGEHWYITLACEITAPDPLPISSEEVGIDLGVSHFAALSDGTFIDNPRHFRKSEKKLAKKQQAVARKKRGSKRRKKAIQQVARVHRKIARQRKDFLHKHSRTLVQKHQIIVFEDLQPGNLSKRAKPKQDAETGQYLPNGGSAKSGLNKSITDAGWGYFVGYCLYKAESAGRTLIKVNPRFTSQICSGCGQVRKKDLSERWHSCDCGCELDRDTNAAINILKLGQKTVLAGLQPSGD